MDILEWSLGLGGWISIAAFVCIAQTGNLDAVRYILYVGIPIVTVSILYAVFTIAWTLLLIVLWAITLMFRRDILFTVFVVGFLALLSATIHNAHTLLQGEEDMGNDMLAPIRTVVKLAALVYDRMVPGGFRMMFFLDKYRHLIQRQVAPAASQETTPVQDATTPVQDATTPVQDATTPVQDATTPVQDATQETTAAEVIDPVEDVAVVDPPLSQEHED